MQYIFLGLLIFFELVADVFAKEWSLKAGILFFILSIGSYIAANVFWLFALRSGENLARGAIIFSVSSAILAIIIGTIFYKEEVTKFQFAGMIVGVIAIALLFWE